MLLRLLREKYPDGCWTATELAVGSLVQLDSVGPMWGEVPRGAVSDLIEMVERIQLAIAVTAFVTPRKAQVLYLGSVRKALADAMRRARSLPTNLEQLPREVQALTMYYRLQRTLPRVAREVHRKLYSTDLPPDMASVRHAAEVAGLSDHKDLRDEELQQLGQEGRVTSDLAARLAVRKWGLGIAPSTFVRKYVDPKHPGWPRNTRRRTAV